MFVEFFIWKDGEWFDIGQEPAFFKEYSRDWEVQFGIAPFLKVKERVFIQPDKVDITLDGDNE